MLAAPALAWAQIGAPPEFQSKGTFQKSGAAAVDGTSHASAEQTQIHAALVEHLRRLPGHADGVRMIDNGLLTAALERFRSQKLPLGIAVTEFLLGRPEASADHLLSAANGDRNVVPFLGETVGAVPSRAPAILDAIRSSAAAHPESGEAQYYLARALGKQAPPRHAEAIPILRHAADLDASDTRALLELGRIYTALEMRTEAIAALEESLTRDGSLATAHFRLAGLYRAAKQPEKSREHMLQFQKLQRPQR